MEIRYRLVGSSPTLREIERQIDCAARSDGKVRITGETGVGKEIVARLIHQRSPRSSAAFVTINCAGVPDSLLESELFGHVRGSFTDAYRDKRGWLEQAHGTDLPRDLLGKWPKPELATAQLITLTPDILIERMTIGGEPFWSVVHEPFMSRDLTRQDLRAIIRQGLEQTRGSYKTLLRLFYLQPEDYKRFLNFLRKYDCQMPFQQFRVVPARAEGVRQSPARLAARA
jgi:hypothetical protein